MKKPLRIHEHVATTLLAGIILVSHLALGIPHIGSFITADEHYWVEERIPDYFDAWARLKWKKTLINDKPGVSLALVSGPALLFHPGGILSCRTVEGHTSTCDPAVTSSLYASFRFPILVTNALMLVAIFFAIRAFSGTAVAFMTAIFAAVSPQLVGMSQIVNPDSLLWSSGALAIFSMAAFLTTLRKRHLITAILSLCLALLSKYVALIIILFLPALLLGIHLSDEDSEKVGRRLQRFLGTVLTSFVPLTIFVLAAPGVLSSDERIIAFLSADTGNIFLPWGAFAASLAVTATVMFARIPKRVVRRLDLTFRWLLAATGVILVLSIMTLIVARLTAPSWDYEIFRRIPFDIKNISDAKYYTDKRLTPTDVAALEFSPFVYSLPAAVLILGTAALFNRSLRVMRDRTSVIPLLMALFIAIELAAFAGSGIRTTPRYVLLTLPIFCFPAADTAVRIGRALRGRLPERLRSFTLPAIITLSVFASLSEFGGNAPFHANFANALLPKDDLTAHAWGYGGYEAVQYLNSLPDADHLTVWSDYYGVCEFFRGNCLTNYTFDKEVTRPDYYVLTRRGMFRYLPRYDDWEQKSGLTAYRYYDSADPAWELDVTGKKDNFVKVIQVKDDTL
ncbi:MAG: glycosyltransferase family 39 protein [Candidatus Moranbacteria bacterium]|nr:glycosyltransferase family 39 protein [Candidatus Moranbacteria bacterium]